MARKSLHPIVLALAATVCASAAVAARAQTPMAAKGICFATSETREEIKAHHLLEPFVALKSAAATVKAEALSAKLCRLGDEFVYEIALLHRDGRLVHVVMNAVTGKLANPRAAHETPPRT
jgi:uncharacterized membrane protein YkoI